MNGILKWSLAQVDTTQPSQLRPLSDEDRKFLDEAIKSITVDPVARMKEITALLKRPDNPHAVQAQFMLPAAPSASSSSTASSSASAAASSSSSSSSSSASSVEYSTEAEVVAAKEAALDELDDLVLQIDYAQDLHKIGGLVPLINTLKSTHPSLQARAAAVISTVCQNNPQSQQWALDNSVMPLLINLLHHADPQVPAKALLALSSLVKSNELAEVLFMKNKGYIAVCQMLMSPATSTKARVKSLSLLRHLWSKDAYKELPRDSPLPAALVHLLWNDELDIREQTLRCLLELVMHSANIAVLTEPALDLKTRLTNRAIAIRALETQEDRDQCRDELELIESLLSQI